MPRMKLRFAVVFLLSAAVAAMGAFACGSDEGSGSAGGSGAAAPAESNSQPAPTTVAAQPTAAPPSVEEGEADIDSGMRVDEVTIDAAGYGGKARILITNVLEEDCTGPVISVELLDADGKVVGDMGVGGSGPLPAGEQKKYEQRYVGKSVVGARVAAITCDNTGASHGLPRSPSKTQAAGGK